MELLQCKDLYKSYGKKEVLKGVNITIPRGKVIGLLGKNGTGKSTIIKLINGLLTPTSGEILFEGKPLSTQSRLDISYLPERTYLDKSMRVEQVIKYFADFYSNFDSEKAYKLLSDLELDTHQRIVNMSKGMQEKVQLVMVMSRNAKLYILDEPLGGVDPATREYILDTIMKNFSEEASVIISTHLIADIERILDKVIFIEKGKIALFEDADYVREENNKSIDDVFRGMFKC